jgi:O-antigen ligase
MRSRELPYGIVFIGLAAAIIVALVLGKPWVAFSVPVVILMIAILEKPLLLFYALCLAIPFSVETQLTASLGTDLPDEPLMWLNTISVGVILCHQRQKFSIAVSHPIVVLFLLSWFWSWVTVFNAGDQLLSLKFILAKTWYLVPFLLGSILFIDNADRLKTAVCCIVVPMVFLSALTLLRHAGQGFSFEDVSIASMPFFRNHVNYGALLVCSIPPVYYLYRCSRNPGWLLALVILLVALYFSYSRGAWLALIVALLVVFIVKRNWMGWLISISIVIILGASVWLLKDNRYLQFRPDFKSTVYHKALSDHMEATYDLKDLSAAERFYRWIAGWRMAKANLVTGIGPNHFYPEYKSYTAPTFRTWVSANPERSTVHNYFILLLSEQGVPGLIFFVLAIIVMLMTSQRIYIRNKDEHTRQIGLVVAAVLGMIIVLISLSDLIETDKIGSVFYICAGVLVAASSGSYIKGVTKSVTQQVERKYK